MINIIRILSLALCLHLLTARILRLPAQGSLQKGYTVSLFVGPSLIESSYLHIDTAKALTVIPCADCLKCTDRSRGLYNPVTSLDGYFLKCVEADVYRLTVDQFARKSAKTRGRSFAPLIRCICKEVRSRER